MRYLVNVLLVALLACAEERLEAVPPIHAPPSSEAPVLTGFLRGRLCDPATGDWARGVGVELSQEATLIASTSTDQEGVYELAELAPGLYRLAFSWASGREERSVSVSAGETTQASSDPESCDPAWSFTYAAGDLCATTPSDSVQQVLDVLFVVDTTGSMGFAIQQLQTNMLALIEGMRELGDDAHFGVAHYQDFPSEWGDMGAPTDRPYILLTPLTDDADAVQTGINSLTDEWGSPVGSGGDEMESTLEALYQAVTGFGCDDDLDGVFEADEVAPSDAGWRPNAFKAIVLVTDAGVRDPDAGDPAPPGAHGRAATLEMLEKGGMQVLGLVYQYSLGLDVLRGVAEASGAVSATGVDGNADGDFSDPGELAPSAPLVFLWNESGQPIGVGTQQLSDVVVLGIGTLLEHFDLRPVLVVDASAAGLSVASQPVALWDIPSGEQGCFALQLEGEVAARSDAAPLHAEVAIIANGTAELSRAAFDFTPVAPGSGYD